MMSFIPGDVEQPALASDAAFWALGLTEAAPDLHFDDWVFWDACLNPDSGEADLNLTAATPDVQPDASVFNFMEDMLEAPYPPSIPNLEAESLTWADEMSIDPLLLPANDNSIFLDADPQPVSTGETTFDSQTIDPESLVPCVNIQPEPLELLYKCPICPRTFNRLEYQTRHVKAHAAKSLPTCHFPGCGRYFARAMDLSRHTRLHTSRKRVLRKDGNLPDAKANPDQLAPSSSDAQSLNSRQSKFTFAAVTVLENWLLTNQDNPYPSPAQKDSLTHDTGLTQKQVSTWLNNARSRKFQDPLAAYLSSSSDSEAASEESVRRAAASLSAESPANSSTIATDFARSVSASSTSSAFDDYPAARWAGPSRRGRRKHRRGYAKGYHAYAIASPASSTESVYQSTGSSAASPAANYPATPSAYDRPEGPLFQCTFCWMLLSEKSWKRHEETHVPQRQWPCMPHNTPCTGSDNKIGCVFCSAEGPLDADHAHHCHRIAACLKRPLWQRSFPRKDKLVQHLKRYHGTILPGEILDLWSDTSSPRDTRDSWLCGFCGLHLVGWDVRAKHIGQHFRDGLNMNNWRSAETWAKDRELAALSLPLVEAMAAC